MTDALTNDEQSALAYTFAVKYPERLRERPNVLWHISAVEDAIRQYEAGETTSLRDFAASEGIDLDDEPWGDPVGLGMPRPRMTLGKALWHIATWKYRRIV